MLGVGRRGPGRPSGRIELRDHARRAGRAAHRAAQRDVAIEVIGRYNPDAVVCVGVPFGHTRPQWIVPYGGSGDRRRRVAKGLGRLPLSALETAAARSQPVGTTLPYLIMLAGLVDTAISSAESSAELIASALGLGTAAQLRCHDPAAGARGASPTDDAVADIRNI